MTNRSSYLIRRAVHSEKIVWIEDEGGDRKSITNDAEAVCADVNAIFPGWRIAYKDTDGKWSELVHKDGKFVCFTNVSLNAVAEGLGLS